MYQVAHPHLCCLTSFQCYLSRHGRDHTRTRLTQIPGQVGILKVWTPILITQKELRKWIGGFQNISADTTFVISLLLISNGLTSYVTSPHLISSVFRILELSPLHQFAKISMYLTSSHRKSSHRKSSHLIAFSLLSSFMIYDKFILRVGASDLLMAEMQWKSHLDSTHIITPNLMVGQVRFFVFLQSRPLESNSRLLAKWIF